jgi:hypothetical protein
MVDTVPVDVKDHGLGNGSARDPTTNLEISCGRPRQHHRASLASIAVTDCTTTALDPRESVRGI